MAVRQLAERYHRSPDQLSEEQLRQYFLYLANEKNWARGSTTTALCGIKFFYQQTLQRDWPTNPVSTLPSRNSDPGRNSASAEPFSMMATGRSDNCHLLGPPPGAPVPTCLDRPPQFDFFKPSACRFRPSRSRCPAHTLEFPLLRYPARLNFHILNAAPRI
ncbi:MAG: site-specific integrase [Acidobacteriota bacterium]